MSVYPGLDLWNLGQHIVSTEETAYIPWEVIEDVFGPLLWEQFRYWMRGQTSVAEGAYPYDIDRFLRGIPILD